MNMNGLNQVRKKSAPKFSIIMNVYNGENYLRAALDSVFAQTYTDWELIFWDDHSTDKSAELLHTYPEDERVRYYFSLQQVPLGQAREAAIAVARGEWLAFLDHDDIWTADKLEKQAHIIDEKADEDLALVYGRAMKFNNRNMVADYDRWHEFGDMPEGDIFDDLFVDGCFICQSAVCLKTSAVREIGSIPDEHECSPDYFFYTELMSKYKAACTQDIVCWYRIHDGAMSKDRYIHMQGEILSIAARWKHRLDPAVYQRRRRIQNTLWGLRQMTSGERPVDGLARIVRDGSVTYLLSRPFVKSYRGLRRALRHVRYGIPKRPTFP